MSRPSTSQVNGHKRGRATPVEDTKTVPNIVPLADTNSWYYPGPGHDSDDEYDPPVGLHTGNWGNKHIRGARWVKTGKIAMWGPTMDDWEEEERTRKRIKMLIPRAQRSPSPPVLPHLVDQPPLTSPHPQPAPQHYSYTSFVLDKSVVHSFRSKLLDELEQATRSLVESQAKLKRSIGRLWQAINEEPTEDASNDASAVVPKKEDEDSASHHHDRLARAPDLTPPVQKLFLLSYTNGTMFEPSHFAAPETQIESLEKSMTTIRELQEDSREYLERLYEIGEGIGEAKAQRDIIWDEVRTRAIDELQDIARTTAVENGT